MKIISIDLNWKPDPPKAGRIAVTIADKEGYVYDVVGGLGDSGLLSCISGLITEKNSPSIILLDIPIDGCKFHKGQHFRLVERALVSNGFPLLPSSKAGLRGSRLKKKILSAAGKRTRVYEIYPYAVYKFISYLGQKGALPMLSSMKASNLLDRQFRTYWPPKYKRERTKRMRVKCMKHVLALLKDPHIGLAFKQPLPAPSMSANLSALADRYDACLGAIAGIHLANKSPFAKIVGDESSGEILLLADEWLVENFRKANIKIR